MKIGIIYLALVSLVVTVIAACGKAVPKPTIQPTATEQTIAEPATHATATPQQFTAGFQVYSRHCSRCHGATLVNGYAAKLSRSALAKYGTAQKLFEYLRQTMPKGNQGVLSIQEYYDVASYLLFQQNLLRADQVLNADTAGSITLSE